MEVATVRYPVSRIEAPLLEMVCRHYQVEMPEERLVRKRPQLRRLLLIQQLEAKFGPMVDVPVAFLKATQRHGRPHRLAG